MGSNTMLSIGALVVLGLFMLTSNAIINSSTQTMIRSEHYITAIGLAQSIVDEAKTKYFDEKVIGKTSIKSDSLTPVAGLGYDGTGEQIGADFVDLAPAGQQTERQTGSKIPRSLSLFDDVDDYNNYTRIVRTPSNGVDTFRCTINYASITYPDSIVAQKTFCKRIRIAITGQYFPGSLTLEYPYIY